MIRVTPRARRYEDRAGDPLDGLVNLFDVGIVLAVGFLLAALASVNLTDVVTRTGLSPAKPGTIVLQPGQTLHDVPSNAPRTAGRGTQVGTVYRLQDGRLVYVVGPDAAGNGR
jgi:hypothetical protein